MSDLALAYVEILKINLIRLGKHLPDGLCAPVLEGVLAQDQVRDSCVLETHVEALGPFPRDLVQTQVQFIERRV